MAAHTLFGKKWRTTNLFLQIRQGLVINQGNGRKLLKVSFFLYILLFIGVFSSTLSAQAGQLYFKQLTSKDGLSENVINSIYQDDRGLMWFGTNDGLNKFDGYNFTVYKPDNTRTDAISSNLIFSITADFHDRLWVGTTGKGIDCLDLCTEKFTSFKHQKDNPNSISSNHVIDLTTDRNGRIWIATDNGISVISFNEAKEPQITQLALAPFRSNQFITNIFEDKTGNIWIGTRDGLLKITQPNLLADLEIKKVLVDPRLPNSQVQSIAEDNYGNLVVGATIGLFIQTDPVNDESFTLINPLHSIDEIKIDAANNIWAGSYRGIYQYKSNERGQIPNLIGNYTTSLENPNAISDNIVSALCIDKKGLIWIGSIGEGVNYFDPNRKPFLHYGKKLIYNNQNYNKIRAILEDSNDYLWLGTEGGGLFHNQSQHYDSFVSTESSDRILALAEIKIKNKKMLWVGAQSPPFLQQIDITNGRPNRTETISAIPGSVFAILQDQHRTIWIGTYSNGIYRWKILPDGTFEKSHFTVDNGLTNGPADNIIRKIFEDRRGNIWLGTGNGLNRISAKETQKEQPVFEVFQHDEQDKKSISHNYILDINESSTGAIWIGTLGGGLNKYSPAKNNIDAYFTAFGEKEGLPNTSIKSILEDNRGNIWVSSNKGLSQLDPKTLQFKNYYSSGGLQGYEYLDGAALRRRNEDLLFGGVNGFNAFQPEGIKENKTEVSIILTQLEVLNKKVNVGELTYGRSILSKVLSETKEISLNYQENNFSIAFSALDFGSVESTQYQYQLEGFDNDWIKADANSRKATYTNLPSGDYTLKVKATNQDGFWTKEAATLGIQIIPPWYLTIPAYISYGCLALGLLFLYRRYAIINIQEKHELIFERLNKEKREELNQMKLQFFTNISHELRTPLTLIIAPLEQLLQKGKSLKPEEIQQQYHFMYKNSKYLLRMVNQLLDFRKLDQGKMQLIARQGNIVTFIKEIAEPFQFLANKQQIEFKVESQDVGLFMWFDANFIEKIVYNLLSNAFKFTPKGGNITIQFSEISPSTKQLKKSKSKHFLEISIKDSGPGMSSNVAKKIFQRFFKEGGKQENKDGAGIGLAYTKSLVERHYGTINLATAIGKGATFSVILPMDREAFSKQEINRTPIQQFDKSADPLEYFMPEPLAGIEQSTALGLAAELPQDELPLLLFIDDNADIRKFIQSGLKNDFRVIMAENGKIGYELALSSVPDLIISDIMMPEMDGIELCNTLKENRNTSHIPIVLLTAKTNIESEIEGLKTGADAYVKKPFKLDILKMQLLNIHRQREKLKSKFRKDIILQPSEVTVTSADEAFLQRAVSLVEDHMDNSEFNVEALVKEMYISRSKLYLKIKALTGQSTSEFIRTVRLKRAVQLLEKSDYTIKEIMFMTGFNTASYFSKCFKQQFGVVPSEYVRASKKPKVFK